jgi:hypothetical protein
MKTFIDDIKYLTIGIVFFTIAVMADIYDSIKRNK